MTKDAGFRAQDSAPPSRARRHAGKRADLSGRAAEQRTIDAYGKTGYDLVETRWRGQGGEIDLILAKGDLLVFAEVKKARSVDAAINSLLPTQMRRIHAAASEYLGQTPNGQLSEVRFDLAAMDDTGQVQIFENAFGHF